MWISGKADSAFAVFFFFLHSLQRCRFILKQSTGKNVIKSIAKIKMNRNVCVRKSVAEEKRDRIFRWRAETPKIVKSGWKSSLSIWHEKLPRKWTQKPELKLTSDFNLVFPLRNSVINNHERQNKVTSYPDKFPKLVSRTPGKIKTSFSWHFCRTNAGNVILRRLERHKRRFCLTCRFNLTLRCLTMRMFLKGKDESYRVSTNLFLGE